MMIRETAEPRTCMAWRKSHAVRQVSIRCLRREKRLMVEAQRTDAGSVRLSKGR